MTRHAIGARKARPGHSNAGHLSPGGRIHHAHHPDRKRLAEIGHALVAMHSNPNTQAGPPTPGEATAMHAHAAEVEALAAKYGAR